MTERKQCDIIAYKTAARALPYPPKFFLMRGISSDDELYQTNRSFIAIIFQSKSEHRFIARAANKESLLSLKTDLHIPK